MSQLNNIVQVTISRETIQITRANFGTPAIISEFAATKTTTTFDRYRDYANLTEMTDDGWLTTDKEYIRASKIFSQDPRPDKVMVGRKKPDSEAVETWTAALTAIQTQNTDWYAFTIDSTQSATTTFDADFITGNLIDFTINGTAVTQVPFNSTNAQTYTDIETQIETDITNSIVTVDAVLRTVKVEIEGGDVNTQSVVVTGGASQATGTTAFLTEDDIKEAAAWAETQKKIYFVTSNDADIPTSSTSDLFSDLEAFNYDRTAMQYHPDLTTSDQFFSEGWLGVMLPKDPGSATWKFKNISGITSYNLTSSERGFVLGKNGNIYTETAGVDITEEGVVASGEYIDIIRGIDWLEAIIAENIYSTLVNVDKIPFTNEGIASIEGLLRESLDEAVRAGLIADDYVTTVPKVADISTANKLARTLPDVEFTATLQGAIHKVEIQGTVSV